MLNCGGMHTVGANRYLARTEEAVLRVRVTAGSPSTRQDVSPQRNVGVRTLVTDVKATCFQFFNAKKPFVHRKNSTLWRLLWKVCPLQKALPHKKYVWKRKKNCKSCYLLACAQMLMVTLISLIMCYLVLFLQREMVLAFETSWCRDKEHVTGTHNKDMEKGLQQQITWYCIPIGRIWNWRSARVKHWIPFWWQRLNK